MYQLDNDRLVCSLQPEAVTAVIPETVTTIGKAAFAQHVWLTAVTLPPALKTIGDDAFSGCASLRSISFPGSLRRLGNGCFRGCTRLTEIVLPDSVASIHAQAFQGCTQLKEVRLPKGMRRNLESGTFGGCASLERITIPAGVQQIKPGAFSGCISLREVIFENPGVQIDKAAFSACPQLNEDALEFIADHIVDPTVTDIRSRASGAAGRLSNYTERRFTFCGIECHSIEGVLQSFKCPDPDRQRSICLLSGGAAKYAGSQFDWKAQQLLYWQGQTYERRSAAYQQLVDQLYDAVFEQDESFRRDLASLRGKPFDHRMGLSNPSETVLTRHEFVFRLRRLAVRGTHDA